MTNIRGVGHFSKMSEEFNFNFYKNFDVIQIQEHLKTFNEEWVLNTFRQDTYIPHKDTNTYFLMDHSNNWLYGDEYKLIEMYQDISLWKLIEPIVKDLEQKVMGKMGKVILVKLPAGKKVGKHNDHGDYLDVVRRFHIPIFTNDNVVFTINNEFKNMKVGECWEINNSKVHDVSNNGNTDRVHLLFDIMPNWAIEAFGSVDRSITTSGFFVDPNHV